MALSMYQISVPAPKMLGNLAAILDKGAAFAEAKKVDPSVLLGYRLAPDISRPTTPSAGLPAWPASSRR